MKFIACFRRTAPGLALVVIALSIGAIGAAGKAAIQAGRSAGPSSIRLYVFDGGTLESDPARYELTKDDVGTTELAVGIYLIVHPKGVLLWDAGAIPDGSWTPTGRAVQQQILLADGRERRVTIRTPLHAQLTAAGFAAASVTHLALSHYHWDHTANANAFAGATWLVRQLERDAMFVDAPSGPVWPKTYAALRNSRTVVIKDDQHDVFGDGKVVLKSAPGHTPGHQVLYVVLSKTGGVVLSGDLYHYPQERTLNRLPVFEFNADETRASRRSIDAFLERTGAQLWIQHDFQADAKLKKAPAYYE
jgi:glyoxylase-like metal-dependent hydrolase (beta-lactamase superfamily II)